MNHQRLSLGSFIANNTNNNTATTSASPNRNTNTTPNSFPSGAGSTEPAVSSPSRDPNATAQALAVRPPLNLSGRLLTPTHGSRPSSTYNSTPTSAHRYPPGENAGLKV